MATKKEELRLLAAGEGILSKIDDDEPIFILRGQDKLAPALVGLWIDFARLHGASPEKYEAALRLELAMLSWQKRTGRAKWPD